MKFTLFFTHYALWHYGKGVRQLLRNWANFLWFTYHFFSIPLLLRTLFSPFERLSEEYKSGLDIGSFLGTLLVNTIMRFIGALVRLFIIGMGAVMLLMVLVLGLLLFVTWLLLPLIIFAFIILGAHGVIQWIR